MNFTILDLVPNECPHRDPMGDIRPEWRDGWNACRESLQERFRHLNVYERNMLILHLAQAGARC